MQRHTSKKKGRDFSSASPLLIGEWITKELGVFDDRTICFGDVSAWVVAQLPGLNSDVIGQSVALDRDALTDKGEWDEELLQLVALSKAKLPRLTYKRSMMIAKGFVPLQDNVPICMPQTRLECALFGASLKPVEDCYLQIDKESSLLVLKDGGNVLFKKELPLPKLPAFIGSIFNQSDEGLLMIPYYTKEGVKCFVKGMSDSVSKQEWLRAYAEAIVFSLKVVVDSVKLGQDLMHVYISGELSQFLSNILQLDIVEVTEMPAPIWGCFSKLIEDMTGLSAKKVKGSWFWSPTMDPISSYALYNQWSQEVNTV